MAGWAGGLFRPPRTGCGNYCPVSGADSDFITETYLSLIRDCFGRAAPWALLTTPTPRIHWKGESTTPQRRPWVYRRSVGAATKMSN